MSKFSFAVLAFVACTSAALATTLPEADETARLEALPVSHIPLRAASLASAIRLLASDAHLSYLAPPDGEFPDRITSDVTMNPYDLLRALSDDYGFTMEYRNGMWHFRRVNVNELITKAYTLRFDNLEKVTMGSANLNTQLAGASGGGGGAGGMSGLGGSGAGQGLAGGLGGGGGGGGGSSGGTASDMRADKIIENIKAILDVPTGALDPSGLDGGAVMPTMAVFKDLKTPKVQPIWNPDTSQLFVVATRQQHALIAAYLRTVDQPQKLIRISVKFVETARDPQQALGVDWANTPLGNGGPITLSGIPSGSGSTGSVTSQQLQTTPLASAVDLSHFASSFQLPTALLSAPAFNFTIQAIASDNRSSVVQDPVIFTSNNHEVTFASTTEEPIQQGSTTFGSATAATSTQIAYLEVGTQLKVLPNLLPGGGPGKEVVMLNLSINVSSIIGTQIIGGNPYPVTSNKTYTYSVPIPTGQTLAIAGLEERTRSVSDSKVPLFGDVPVLGYLFKNRSDAVTHTTLLAFITPEVVDEPGVGEAAVAMSLPAMHHRRFEGTSGESLHQVNQSLSGLPSDIAALQECATPQNKEAVLNRLDQIAVELSLMDVRLGELKLTGDKVSAMQSNLVVKDRELESTARDAVLEIH